MSAYKLTIALTIWWEAGKLACMGLRYLETEYMATQRRCGTQHGGLARAGTDGADRSSMLPEHWRTKFLARVASVTQEEEDVLANPVGKAVKEQAKAKTFLMEVALVDYVSRKNQSGLGVSVRGILERKGFLLDPEAVQSHSRLKPLPRKVWKWVARWQKRHGLTRGRFRGGSGLTQEQQRAKVCMFENCTLAFRFCRDVFLPQRGVCFFRKENCCACGPIFEPAWWS